MTKKKQELLVPKIKPWGARIKNRLHLRCSGCGMELFKLDWNDRCYLYACDNLDCDRFRQPQGTELKGGKDYAFTL